MNLDGMSQDIKEMVFRKAMEGREKEDAKISRIRSRVPARSRIVVPHRNVSTMRVVPAVPHNLKFCTPLKRGIYAGRGTYAGIF